MLKELRGKLELNQEELAIKIGVSRPTITRAENGRMSVKTAKKLSKFFKVDWKIFFDEKRTKNVRKK